MSLQSSNLNPIVGAPSDQTGPPLWTPLRLTCKTNGSNLGKTCLLLTFIVTSKYIQSSCCLFLYLLKRQALSLRLTDSYISSLARLCRTLYFDVGYFSVGSTGIKLSRAALLFWSLLIKKNWWGISALQKKCRRRRKRKRRWKWRDKVILKMRLCAWVIMPPPHTGETK